MLDRILKPIRWVLVSAFLACFAFNFAVISIGRTRPVAPDATHTYPLSLKGWGVHYMTTAIGEIYPWTWKLGFFLVAAVMLLGLFSEMRRRRTEDDRMKKLTSGGHLGPSAN